jgi:hypothetical protein
MFRGLRVNEIYFGALVVYEMQASKSEELNTLAKCPCDATEYKKYGVWIRCQGG